MSIDDWKDILIKNVHPASFKVFGELNLEEYGYTANKDIDFELTKSVELARDATVPNIQSFALQNQFTVSLIIQKFSSVKSV